jgi:hypothetical protein
MRPSGSTPTVPSTSTCPPHWLTWPMWAPGA